jgi:hypothetical protein
VEAEVSVTLTADHVRIARDLLGWSQYRLSVVSGVPFSAVATLERSGLVREAVEARLRSTLEQAGIEIQTGPNVFGSGVRRRPALATRST